MMAVNAIFLNNPVLLVHTKITFSKQNRGKIPVDVPVFSSPGSSDSKMQDPTGKTLNQYVYIPK